VFSVLPERDRTAWISAQRPARAAGLDAFKPHGFFVERERSQSGRVVNSGVILLTNRECPWRCLMCDLWKNTLTETVPLGAIPQQIDYALAQLGCRPEQLKLYNSGSFFDPAAVPVADYAAIASKLRFAELTIVESHPRLVGRSVVTFQELLSGSLEVAMGLETVHPEVLPRLNKKFTLRHFAQAAEFLRDKGIAMRTFVLVKPPFLDEFEAVEWAVKSAEFAFGCGADVVSLLPTRGGNGALDRLQETGGFSPPKLATLEKAQEGALALGKRRVFADTWDLGRFSTCSNCFEARRARIQGMNLQQVILPRIPCQTCAGA
jgi:radical SAM enzyme (TIGR01210 family)